MAKAMIVGWTVIAFSSIACAADTATAAATESKVGTGQAGMYAPLLGYLAKRAAEFDLIEGERKAQLDQLADSIRAQHAAGEPVRLLFVCTHNSRRSHMAQLWAAAAAEACGLQLATYSGGTETSAFNPRAVAAMERAGFRVAKTTADTNPVYHVRMGDSLPPMTCFSKKFDDAPNPQDSFTAVMVCSHADRTCPKVSRAGRRVAIPYVDPKAADNTPQEEAAYAERSAQIAREMLYVMTRAGA